MVEISKCNHGEAAPFRAGAEYRSSHAVIH